MTKFKCVNCDHPSTDHDVRVAGGQYLPIPTEDLDSEWSWAIRCREGKCPCEVWSPA